PRAGLNSLGAFRHIARLGGASGAETLPARLSWNESSSLGIIIHSCRQGFESCANLSHGKVLHEFVQTESRRAPPIAVADREGRRARTGCGCEGWRCQRV